MRDTQRSINEASLRELSARAHRLATAVEAATRGSTNAGIRREGARLGEILAEWLEELRGLLERQDASLAERVESFETRLRMAEGKVDHWPVPATTRAPTPRKRAKATSPEPELELEERPWYADDIDDELPIATDPAKKASRGGKSKKSAA